ncbi:MAG: hypothetical protein Q4D21_06645 [Phascolarctobacterium sp.]|nr:hypothetical protein [Phascolarctobacterium sp.]
MRVTTHNGRTNKNGVYSPKHNDRAFNTGNAENIHQELTVNNYNWHCYAEIYPEMTFDEVEHRFYLETFGDALNAKNNRYIAQRHPERCQTIDEYRSCSKSCPEETILQIGCLENTVNAEILLEVCMNHIKWEQETFPNVKVLDAALHVDEDGAPHMHIRKVWLGHDKEGNLIVGQSKALGEMNIEPPFPQKKYGRHNNAKMTYTKMCRDHFLELCTARGLNIELEPKEVSQSGLTLLEYKRVQEKNKLESTKQDFNQLKNEYDEMEVSLNQKKYQFEAAKNMAEKHLKTLDDAPSLLDSINNVKENLKKIESNSILEYSCQEQSVYDEIEDIFSRVVPKSLFLKQSKTESVIANEDLDKLRLLAVSGFKAFKKFKECIEKFDSLLNTLSGLVPKIIKQLDLEPVQKQYLAEVKADELLNEHRNIIKELNITRNKLSDNQKYACEMHEKQLNLEKKLVESNANISFYRNKTEAAQVAIKVYNWLDRKYPQVLEAYCSDKGEVIKQGGKVVYGNDSGARDRER